MSLKCMIYGHDLIERKSSTGCVISIVCTRCGQTSIKEVIHDPEKKYTIFQYDNRFHQLTVNCARCGHTLQRPENGYHEYDEEQIFPSASGCEKYVLCKMCGEKKTIETTHDFVYKKEWLWCINQETSRIRGLGSMNYATR